MYSASPGVDISGDLRSLRQEERDRDAKNWKGSRDLLRSVATDAIRKDYGDGLAWDESVESADATFKKQYERLMSVDPTAAAQLKADYAAERGRRVNAEVSSAYEDGANVVGGDIAAIEAEIARLESEVAAEEASMVEAEKDKVAATVAAEEGTKAASRMAGYYSIDQGSNDGYVAAEDPDRVAMGLAGLPAAPAIKAMAADKKRADAEYAASLAMQGYTPNVDPETMREWEPSRKSGQRGLEEDHHLLRMLYGTPGQPYSVGGR